MVLRQMSLFFADVSSVLFGTMFQLNRPLFLFRDLVRAFIVVHFDEGTRMWRGRVRVDQQYLSTLHCFSKFRRLKLIDKSFSIVCFKYFIRWHKNMNEFIACINSKQHN